jgi:D-aminopeptidase
LITGGQVATEQVQDLIPNVDVLIVKPALSNRSGNCIHPLRAQELSRAGADKAVDRAVAGEFQPYVGEVAPYQIEVELKNDLADGFHQNLEVMLEFEGVNLRVMRSHADDLDMGFRRIAYLSFGQRPGLQRY